MENNRRRTGARYEQTAGRYLETKGYQILEYNYRCRRGEIDIIARDQECLVFCEVKYRSGPGAGDAAEAVDAKKQRKLSVGKHYRKQDPAVSGCLSLCRQLRRRV